MPADDLSDLDRPTGREADLLTDIATRFYLHGATQADIAADLGLNPSTVSRHLKRARDLGIVRFEIVPSAPPAADLGRHVAAAFRLGRAVVLPSGSPEQFAAGAAAFVSGQLRTGTRLGLGWGETLASVVRSLVPGGVSDLVVAQLAGGLREPSPGIQAHELAAQVAGLYPGSRVRYLHAPAIVDSAIIRVALAHDGSIAEALAAAADAELALVGVGDVSDAATMFRYGEVTAADRARLLAAGAVGSMNTRFFDAQGRPVPVLEDRTIAIEWDQLRAIPTVVAVAAGTAKAAAIAGALRTGAVDILITDQATAVLLLED
ncbi:MAG: sugar-binding domain-containing protein [Chloroflexota bacterium]